MKVQELIDQLKGYEDFDISITVGGFKDGTDYGMSYSNMDLIGISDIGHSDKNIILEVDDREHIEFIENIVEELEYYRELKKFEENMPDSQREMS